MYQIEVIIEVRPGMYLKEYSLEDDHTLTNDRREAYVFDPDTDSERIDDFIHLNSGAKVVPVDNPNIYWDGAPL